jgi:hypothetical protein
MDWGRRAFIATADAAEDLFSRYHRTRGGAGSP